jgi:hypothetical protein
MAKGKEKRKDKKGPIKSTELALGLSVLRNKK